MRVDFYQLSRDPVERVVVLLAMKALQAGERLILVARDPAQRALLSRALWDQDGAAFLANGEAESPDAERQPIVLSDRCVPANGARMAIIADGEWREEATALDRVMLLFGPDATDAARDLWRQLASRDDIDNRIFKQDEKGAWREGR